MESLDLQLAQLESAQLVRRLVDEERAYLFKHALTQEAAYESLLHKTRREVHQRVAEALEADSGNVPGALRELARHFYLGGNLEKALGYSRRAGEEAEQHSAYNEALRFYAQARECAETLKLDGHVAAIEEEIGDVHITQGLYPLAVEAYGRASRYPSTPEQGAVLKSKIGTAFAFFGDARALDFLSAAEQELNPATQTTELAQTLAMQGRCYHYLGQHTRAIELVQRAAALAEPLDDVKTLPHIYGFLAAAYVHLARFDQAIAGAQKLIALGERKNNPFAVALGYEFMAESLEVLGQWKQALEFSKRSRELGEKIGMQDRVTWSELDCSIIYYGQGKLAEALAAARSGLALAESIGERRVAVMVQAQLAIIETDLGMDQAAHQDAERARMLAEGLRDVVTGAGCRYALAYYYLQRAQWDRAVEQFEDAAGLLAGTEQHLRPLMFAAPHAVAWLAQQQIDTAIRLNAEYVALAQAAQSAHYLAVGRRVQGEISTVQAKWEQAQQAFDEAITTLDELGSRLELGRALYHRGVMFEQWGKPDTARADAERARSIFEQCGAVRDGDLAKKLWQGI